MFISLGYSLVGTGEDSLTLLKVCPAHTDKAEIKCMGFVGGKTPTKSKGLFIFSSLRHIGRDKVDIHVFFSI